MQAKTTISNLKNIIKVGAVSYLNTKPLLFGIENSPLRSEIDLTLDYPSRLAAKLANGMLDLALLPVAAISDVPNAHIVSDYGIAAEGNVVSVALFSSVPLDEIEHVFLDYQSRTSVRLAQLMFAEHWRRSVTYLPAALNYISEIKGTTAGVIIGDRALEQLDNFKYVYDLSAAWKAYCGLDFVFAAWVSNKKLSAEFTTSFNQANKLGLSHLDDVIAGIRFPAYNLHTYYTENIKYQLDEQKLKGLQKFLSLI